MSLRPAGGDRDAAVIGHGLRGRRRVGASAEQAGAEAQLDGGGRDLGGRRGSKQRFSRSRTERTTQQRTGNQTVAVGASLDIHYSRKFEMNVTGNSAISARLVSVPAPPQFLETVREFLEERGE